MLLAEDVRATLLQDGFHQYCMCCASADFQCHAHASWPLNFYLTSLSSVLNDCL